MESQHLNNSGPPVYELEQRHTSGTDAVNDDPSEYHSLSQQQELLRNHDVLVKTSPFSLAALADYWVLDLAGLVFSAALLVAIAVLLKQYDGRPQPDWNAITLNAMVSWLGTLARVLILVPVARSLGQLKWTWLAGNRRKLADLQKFDAASRGAAGSVQLLFSKLGWHLQALGCVTTVLAIGIGPFLQNSIEYIPQMVVDATQPAYITNTSSYREFGAVVNTEQKQIHPVLKANIYNSILNIDPDQRWAIPRYSCTTGNCTFDPITTVSARAQCSDLVNVLKHDCVPFHCLRGDCGRNCTARLDPGMSLSYMTRQPGGDLMKSQVSEDSTTTIIRYIAVKNSSRFLTGSSVDYDLAPETSPLVAAECSISFGVEALQETITNSTYKMKSIGFWQYGKPAVNLTRDETLLAWWRDQTRRWGNVTVFDDMIPTLPSGYDIGGDAYFALHGFLEAVFASGHLESSFGSLLPPQREGDQSYASIDIQMALLVGDIPGCASRQDRLICVIENMARAMTKSFRDSAYISSGSFTNATSGNTQINVIHVKVKWPWLAFPVTIWILAAILSFGTAIRTRRARIPIWANDILPLLFLYKTDDARETHEGYGTANADYIKRSERINVQLLASKHKAVLLD